MCGHRFEGHERNRSWDIHNKDWKNERMNDMSKFHSVMSMIVIMVEDEKPAFLDKPMFVTITIVN